MTLEEAHKLLDKFFPVLLMVKEAVDQLHKDVLMADLTDSLENSGFEVVTSQDVVDDIRHFSADDPGATAHMPVKLFTAYASNHNPDLVVEVINSFSNEEELYVCELNTGMYTFIQTKAFRMGFHEVGEGV